MKRYGPLHEKTQKYAYAKIKVQISFAAKINVQIGFTVTAKLISVFNCLPYTNSKIPLLSKSEISSFLAMFCRCTARFESDLVGNPDCWFCQTKAQISS